MNKTILFVSSFFTLSSISIYSSEQQAPYKDESTGTVSQIDSNWTHAKKLAPR